MKLFLISMLKILVTLTCFYFLNEKLKGIDFQNQFLETSPLIVIIAIFIFVSHLFSVAIRWRFFVSKLDGELSYARATQYVAVSAFLNNTPLGLIVGDAYRLLAIHKEKFKLSLAIGSVLLDRYTALLGTCIAPIITVILHSIFHSTNVALVNFILVLTVFTVGLLIFPLLPKIKALRGFLVFDRLKFIFDYLSQLSLIFQKAHLSMHAVLRVYCTTFYVVVSSGVITFFFAVEAGSSLGLLTCLIVTSLALIAGAVPISVGGFGLRELSFVSLLELINVPIHTAIFITASFSLSFFLASLMGALVWLVLSTAKQP